MRRQTKQIKILDHEYFSVIQSIGHLTTVEFGHSPVFDNNIICQCGKKGCLETEVSGQALERKIKEKLREGAGSSLTRLYNIDNITVDDIIHAVSEQEDMLIIEVIEEMGEK